MQVQAPTRSQRPKLPPGMYPTYSLPPPLARARPHLSSHILFFLRYRRYRFSTTVFSSVISLMAYLPPSRPKPLCFTPP